MRRLAFLIVCAGLFGGLLYAMAHLTGEPGEPLRRLSSPGTDTTTNTDPALRPPGFALQLDRSLGQTPVAATPSSSRTPSPLDAFRRPVFASQAALLSAALLLGWLAANWLRARPAAPVSTPERPVTPDLEPSETLQRQARADREALAHVSAQLDEAQRLLDARSSEDLESGADVNQEERSALQSVIASRELEVAESRERATLLEHTIEELRQDLSAAEREIEQLDTAQREQLEQFEQERRESQQVYSEEFEEYDGVMDSLRMKNEEWRQQLASQSEALHSVEQQLNDAQTAHADATRELAEVVVEREAHLETIDGLEKIQASQQEHVSDLLAQLEQLQDSERQRLEQEQALTAIQEHSDTQAARIATLEQEAKAAAEREQELDALEQRHASLEHAHAELELREEQLHAELKQAQDRAADAESLDHEVTTLNAELERVITARDEHIAELSEMHNLFNQAQTRAAQADDLEAEAAQRATELEQVTIARDELQAGLSTLTQVHDTDKARLEQLEQETTDVKHRLDTLLSDLDATRSELDRTQEQLAAVEAEREELQTVKQSLRQQLEELETREHDLRVQFDQTTREHTRLSSENAELTDSIALLREDLADVVRKASERNVEIDELKSELRNREQTLGEKQQRIEELQDRIEQEHIAQESLQQQLESALEFEQKLQTWDSSLQTYRDDILTKNRLIDQLRDAAEASSTDRDQWQTHTEELEEKLKVFVNLQDELNQTREEYAGVGDTLAAQQTELDELLALGQQSDEQLKAHSETLRELENERARWLQTVEQTSRTASELEAELLDQHDVLLTLDEIVSETLAHLGITSEHALLESNSDDPSSTANTLIVRKGKALSALATESAERASSVEQQHQELMQKVTDYELKLNELTHTAETQLTTSREEHDTLSAQLEQAVEHQRKLAQEHSDMEASNAELRSELEERTRTIAALETEHAALKKESEEAQLVLSAELEQQLAQVEHNLQASNQAITQERDDLAAQLEGLVNEHARLEDHAQTLALQVDQQSTEHQDALDQLNLQRTDELEAQRVELQDRIDTTMDEYEKLQAELEHMRQLQKELSSDVESKNQEIDELRRQLSKSQKQFEDQTAHISAQIDQQRQTLDHAATRVTEAEHVWAQTDTALQAANTERQQSEYEVEELRELLRTVERVGASDREALKDLQKELGRKREALDVAEQAFQAQRRQAEEMTAEREAAARQMEAQQVRYTQLEERLKTALAEQRNVNARLRAQLERSAANTAAAGQIPVLTQKVVEGAVQPDIPVLGQPVGGGAKSDKPELPVLEKPIERDKG